MISKLNLNNKVYTITEKKLKKNNGYVRNDKLDIKINIELPYNGQVSVLYHELVHAMLDNSGLTHMLKPKLEEAICNAIGNGIADLISNNKELPKYE